MQTQNLTVPKTLNPHPPLFTSFLPKFPNPLLRSIIPIPSSSAKTSKSLVIQSQFPRQNASKGRDIRAFAGRSKGKPGMPSKGRIEGNAEVRREAKRNARLRSKKMAESLFYRLKNPHGNYPNNFSEEELQMIGLGYDRMVRFMEKDDPNLKHPYDWYKYGEFGPYSWRGVVLGDPIPGGMSDECVTMMGEVRDQEEWDKIEQFDMTQDFVKGLNAMDENVDRRYFWVFVRHPRWRTSDLAWEQWTLVSEVVVEAAGNQRLDKWSLMGRLGNYSRRSITRCAAWMRPDIVYVKRPVYQCRFEPQDEFFKALTPLLDPQTEQDFLFELNKDDGSIELCTYFAGLCKIVKVNPKAFVDDVVKAYEKLSDEKKSKCLEFLLQNHPVPLLHPYTREWKTRLEEMELGCDAPDDDDYRGGSKKGEVEIVDWIEDYGNEDGEDDNEGDSDEEYNEDGNQDDVILDAAEEDEEEDPEEDPKFWEDEFKKAMTSTEGMEKFAKKYMEKTDEYYEEQMKAYEESRKQGVRDGDVKGVSRDDGDELALRGVRAKVSPEEWKYIGIGPWKKKIKKSKIPPELFLRSAVRPFTYKNLVKEIVLTRHALVEGEIGREK